VHMSPTENSPPKTENEEEVLKIKTEEKKKGSGSKLPFFSKVA